MKRNKTRFLFASMKMMVINDDEKKRFFKEMVNIYLLCYRHSDHEKFSQIKRQTKERSLTTSLFEEERVRFSVNLSVCQQSLGIYI